MLTAFVLVPTLLSAPASAAAASKPTKRRRRAPRRSTHRLLTQPLGRKMR
jgi:hypothetical protein